MKLICIGSGSSGNCYILKGGVESLLIEAGVPAAEILRGLRYDLRSVSGCVVSHLHRDHSKSVPDLCERGVKVLAPPSVWRSFDNDKRQVSLRNNGRAAEFKHWYRIGGFKVMAISAFHDVECAAYIIEHEEIGRMLFATDTVAMHTVKGVNHLMIEANYSDSVLSYNIENGITPIGMRDRLVGSHCEFETTKEVIEAHRGANLQTVVLIHLSSENSDGERFKREAESIAGVPVYIAKTGLEIDLGVGF